jgi:hypothetical protein
MAAGSVSTQAINKLRTVPHCSPEWFAIILPATPDERTWVVLTGKSAASIVAIGIVEREIEREKQAAESDDPPRSAAEPLALAIGCKCR